MQAGGNLARDLGAGAETGISQAVVAQAVERGVIQRQPFGLDRHLVPAEPEPFQILQDPGDMFGPRPRHVGVLDP